MDRCRPWSRPPKGVVLDMDSSVSPTHGALNSLSGSVAMATSALASSLRLPSSENSCRSSIVRLRKHFCSRQRTLRTKAVCTNESVRFFSGDPKRSCPSSHCRRSRWPRGSPAARACGRIRRSLIGHLRATDCNQADMNPPRRAPNLHRCIPWAASTNGRSS
jgi:hypothetical protein